MYNSYLKKPLVTSQDLQLVEKVLLLISIHAESAKHWTIIESEEECALCSLFNYHVSPY